MKFMILCAIILAPLKAHADTVMNLHNVKIVSGKQVNQGYLALPYRDELDLSTPDGLAT